MIEADQLREGFKDDWEIVYPNALPKHVSASREEWADALNPPDGPRYRVTRVPRSDNGEEMTEAVVPLRSLGSQVALMAHGDFYCVLVDRAPEA